MAKKSKKSTSRKSNRSRPAAEQRVSNSELSLAPTVEFLHSHLTESICSEVFQDLRTTERERKWSLFALARFWLAVVLEAPQSLTKLLEKTRGHLVTGLLPEVDASSEAFFQRNRPTRTAGRS